MAIQRVRSKWAKTEVLMKDPELRAFVPETRPFTRATVEDMLERFGMIYVKPVVGTFGQGVIRVEKNSQETLPYAFQSGERKYVCAAFDEMFDKLQDVRKRKPYLVQQGIELLRHEGRRFDFRLMVQQGARSKWRVTGLIGRLSHPRKIVTNFHSGGTPMPAEVLLSTYLQPEAFARYRSGLRQMGILTASALQSKFPGIKEIGIDLAVDGAGKPWILEVNTKPDPFLFRHLPDRSVFRRIYRYALRYGRFRTKRRRKK